MTYLVEPLLYELRDPIIKGLTSGELWRDGGGIRVAKGYPGAGQFVGHMRELMPGTLAGAPGAVQLPHALGALLQITNVAAAASVLNLGVSAVGFAVVARKLDRLQASVDQVLSKQDALHGEVIQGFADVQASLVELRFLALEGRELLSEAVALVREVRRDIFDGYVARIQMEAHAIHRQAPSDAAFEQARRTFDEARRWFQNDLDRAMGNPEPRNLLDALVRYRAWCTAVMLELEVLRRMRARRESAELARASGAKSRAFAIAWGKRLVPPEEYGGVFRFGHSRFESLPEEVLLRLFELQEGTRSPENRFARTTDAAHALAERANALPADWFARQEAGARVLDFLEETTARLESVAAELEHCDRLRLNYDEWEGLREPADASSSIAIIRVDRRTA